MHTAKDPTRLRCCRVAILPPLLPTVASARQTLQAGAKARPIFGRIPAPAGQAMRARGRRRGSSAGAVWGAGARLNHGAKPGAGRLRTWLAARMASRTTVISHAHDLLLDLRPSYGESTVCRWVGGPGWGFKVPRSAYMKIPNLDSLGRAGPARAGQDGPLRSCRPEPYRRPALAVSLRVQAVSLRALVKRLPNQS